MDSKKLGTVYEIVKGESMDDYLSVSEIIVDDISYTQELEDKKGFKEEVISIVGYLQQAVESFKDYTRDEINKMKQNYRMKKKTCFKNKLGKSV